MFDTVAILKDQIERYNDKTLIDYTPIDAKKEILNRVGDNQLVLINEAHHRPEHRAFTESLLAELYQLGFRYLAMEAFNRKDTLLDTRNYLIQQYGFYTQEIMFSNLCRTAKEIGFTLIAYEQYSRSQNERDSFQALNIYNQTLAIDDKAKVVVHAGYGHIGENYSEWWRAMGYQLKQISGINPFTIDQTSIPEIRSPECTTPLYASLNEKFNIKEPIVLMKNGKAWRFLAKYNLYDISVLHPPFRKINNRPYWLVSNGRQTRKLPAEVLKDKYTGCLVEVFGINDSEDAVPLDRFEVSQNKQYAVLKTGEYKLIVFDKKRRKKYEGIWKVK